MPRLTFSADIDGKMRAAVTTLLPQMAVPALRGAIHVTLLAGGANNINLVLRGRGHVWTLKLRDPLCTSFGVDPRAAIECQRAAAALGVAPDIVACALPAGHFMSEFIDGTTLRPALIRAQGVAPLIIDTLRRLHTARDAVRSFWIFDDLRTFMQGAQKHAAQCSAELLELHAMAMRMEPIFRAIPAPQALCHNDLVPQNMLLAAGRVKLVDFDYAGSGWIAVDLAGASSQAEMTPQETEAFLAAYDPGLDEAQRARVEAVHFLNALREAAWATYAEPVLAQKTALLQGWSYEAHRRMNLELARGILGRRSLAQLAADATYVRPGARF